MAARTRAALIVVITQQRYHIRAQLVARHGVDSLIDGFM
jgi:hypothetical protein